MWAQEQQLLHTTLVFRSIVGESAPPLPGEYVPDADTATVITSGQHVRRHIRHALHILPAGNGSSRMHDDKLIVMHMVTLPRTMQPPAACQVKT